MARLFWGTTTFDLKLEHLLPAISRFLSTGGDQETTLIDQAITEHRTWKMGGARGPFVGLESEEKLAAEAPVVGSNIFPLSNPGGADLLFVVPSPRGVS